MKKPKILIVDDGSSIRISLRDVLEYEGYEVDDAENGKIALEKIKSTHYDTIFCDIKMPQMSGIEVLEQALTITDTPFIMISAHATIDSAVEAIKKGAYDFISKPVELNRLLITLRNALERSDLIKETKVLKKRFDNNHQMIGNSKALWEIKKMVEKVAATDARVLIMGENGTGKELVANQLHRLSNRANAPFIEVNCAAIPSELIESELFGHEKGSFTSAIKQRKGNFELANGGTLFLDEIGDMSLSAQAKVLRVLQENKITRIGGEKDIHVDVRVIAATNKNLKEEIAKGNFREDLYHRLSVILISVPSLKYRKDDIPLLVEHFLEEICQKQGKRIPKIEKPAIDTLMSLNWTGNVRELRNITERLVILCDEAITKADIERYVK